MNPDKINKWLEFAKSFAGNDFWSDVMEGQRPQGSFSGNSFQNANPQQSAVLYPAVDMVSSERELVVIIDLPGVSKENVQLSIQDEKLYVKGEVPPLFPQHAPVASERFTGSFERSIGLPVRVDGQTVQVGASFHNGTLIVRIPLSPIWKKTIEID